MTILAYIILGALSLNTTHDEIEDSTTVGDILNLGGYNSTNAANWAISKYNETNLAERIDSKYTWPTNGIPITDFREDLQELIYGKQDKLVSGINVKTINNQSIVGTGNIYIKGGGGANTNDVEGIIKIYDITNLTPRINNRIVMPKDWIVPKGLVLTKAETGVVWTASSGSASLGPIAYITDVYRTNYLVRAERNPEGQIVLSVDQNGTTNTMFMTVEQEKARAEIVENLLEDEIKSLSAIGRFVSTWNCSSGRPGTEPRTATLEYKAGDYYLVTAVATNGYNYIPNGAIYVQGSTSTTLASEPVSMNDIYRYTDDGSWVHVSMSSVKVTFSQLEGNPRDNTKLAKIFADISNSSTNYTDCATNALMSAVTNLEYMISSETNRAYAAETNLYAMVTNKQDKLLFTTNDIGRVLGVTSNDIAWVEIVSLTNYNDLINRPIIEGVVVTGGINLAAKDLHLMTNILHTVDDDGKVLGVTNNTIAWVSKGRSAEWGNIGGAITNQIDLYESLTNLDTRIISETNRAYVAETNLAALIDLEYDRATNMEYTVALNATNYTDVATNDIMNAVTNLEQMIYAETNRAYTAETNLVEMVYAETNRAYVAETNLMSFIEFETNRAYVAETNLAEMVYAETNRAYVAETNLYTMVTNKQDILVYGTNDEGKVLGVLSNKLEWIRGGSGSDTIILNGNTNIITGAYVIPQGYGEVNQVLKSNGPGNAPGWTTWSGLTSADVINTTNSTETAKPLSANIGRLLYEGKVNRAGDTMSGNLGFSQQFARVGGSQSLDLMSQLDSLTHSYIWLSKTGEAQIRAGDGTTVRDLYMKSDGTIMWNGRYVCTAADANTGWETLQNGANVTGTIQARIHNGWVIIIGNEVGYSGSDSIFFPAISIPAKFQNNTHGEIKGIMCKSYGQEFYAMCWMGLNADTIACWRTGDLAAGVGRLFIMFPRN